MSFSIIGTGSCLPTCVMTNDQLPIDSSDEWIKSRTGISQRHICADEDVSQIATKAATLALENAGKIATDLDLIICTTMSADYVTPSLACIVQGNIGANCPSFDINVACTGFLYALDIASSYFASKRVKNILVVSAEAMSRIVDWNDRSTCILFGDGAGAVVLSEGNDLLSINLTSNGDTKTLKAENSNGNCPFIEAKPNNPYIVMNGQDVFKFAVNSICKDVDLVLDKAHLMYSDIDYVLTHQANLKIIQAAQSRLPIAADKYITNIETCANTSSASIPLLLDQINKEHRVKKGNIVVLSAFGSGLATGACVVRWNM